MPQQDQSKRLGSSPSPTIDMVTKNSANGQQVLPSPVAAVKEAYNKQPVKVPISSK